MKSTKRSADKAQRMGDAKERAEKRDAALRLFQGVAHNEGSKKFQRARDGLVVAAYLSVRRDGRMAQLHLPGMPPPVDIDARGKCDGFSDDSQRRLVAFLHSLKRSAAMPIMVTLTFPSEVVVTPADAKRCRLAWEKRCRREYGDKWCAIWRMEAHPEMSIRLGRVCPHFHLLTWGAWYELQWVSDSWNEVVWEVLKMRQQLNCLSDYLEGLIREKHRKAGTQTQTMRKGFAGVLYCGKNYLAKEEEYPLGEAGRVWGYSNRRALPVASEVRIPLTATEAYQVTLAVKDWMAEKRIKSDYLVCTFFSDDPSMLVARLMSRIQPLPLRPKT